MVPVTMASGDRQWSRGKERVVRVELSSEEIQELHRVLSGALAELSSEIAATDNAEYRRALRARRDVLEGVLGRLDQA